MTQQTRPLAQAPGSKTFDLEGSITPGFIARIAQHLTDRRVFLPASLSQPPGALPSQTGNRSLLVQANNAPTAVLGLVAGTLTWTFTPPLPVAPVVTYSPVGAPPSSGTTLYLDGPPTRYQVVISSTSNIDARMVHLTARAG